MVPDSADGSDYRFQEWQECRSTIGRLDGILADTRKFGFSLVTVLLTANALVTPKDPIVDRVAAACVILALLLVLFLLDRYYWVLLRDAVALAIELESQLKLHISRHISNVAETTGANVVPTMVYVMFVVITYAVPLVVVVPAGQSVAIGILTGSSLAALLVITATELWNRWRREKGKEHVKTLMG